MKRVLLTSVVMLCAFFSFAQFNDDFDPSQLPGWLLGQGAQIKSAPWPANTASGNAIVTPAAGGNNPSHILTPAINKTSNSVEVCMNLWALNSSLNTIITPIPCNAIMNVKFVKSSVASIQDALDPANVLATVPGGVSLPSAGGSVCFQFTFPASVTDTDFRIVIDFSTSQASCSPGGTKYVIDNVQISGVNDICGGSNCPPGGSDDQFNRSLPGEMNFNAVLFGTPLDPSYPVLPGYAADANGTDGDQNDDHSHLKWQLISGPSNGTVVINDDGTVTITRNSSAVIQLTFTYQIQDDGPDNNFSTPGDNLSSNTTTVTVNWAAASPTPVTFTSFTAGRSKNNVTLKWETASESNNTGFEILRSINNTSFEKIGFVSSKALNGTSTSKLSYEFMDANQNKGVTLYRLRQIDLDGKSQYSQIRSVKGEGVQSSITVYPTPSSSGDVSVSVSGLQSFDLYIVDMNGRTLREYRRTASDYIKINGLQSGMYMVRIVDLKTGEQNSEKIIVNKR